MVKVIVGLMGSSVANGSTRLATVPQVQTYLDACKKDGIVELDTARVYNAGKSEELLGDANTDGLKIATKAPAFAKGSLSYDKVMANANASLAALKTKCIELYYFHGPDRQTPLEESCRAIGELHQAGKIKDFGVSNLRASEVEEIVQICQRNGWVKPTVYQGGYNALARAAEEGLFPTLRKHGIVFYAFSPLAGGFFSRPIDELRTPPANSRMDQMPVFKQYCSDATLGFHEKLTAACEKAGIPMKEAALRWLMHHSILQSQDGVILGASSTEQLEENLQACAKSALPSELVHVFNDMYEAHKASGQAFPYST